MKLDGLIGAEIWRYQDVAPDSTYSSSWIWDGVTSVLRVAVDPDDNVVFVGQTSNSLVYDAGAPGEYDWYVRKLNGTTEVDMWAVQGGSPCSYLTGAEVDASGNLVAVGKSGDGDGQASTFLVVKLSRDDGTIIWTYTDSSSTAGVLRDVAIDSDGNVYVAGGEDVDNLQGRMADHPVVIKLEKKTGDDI